MDVSTRIYLKLLKRGFHVITADDIPACSGGGQRFRLRVGVTISAYASGKVLVQGNFTPRSSKWAYGALYNILPATTQWQLG